jgi:hypothetical protein
MKQSFTLIILLTTLTINAFTQKVAMEKVTYDYIRLPLQSIDAEIKNYYTEIKKEYSESIMSKRLDYERKFEQAKARYDQQLKYWLDEVDSIEMRYEAALEEYAERRGLSINSSAVINAPDAPKPLPYPRKPRKDFPEKPYFPRDYDLTSLERQFGEIEGYTRSQDNAISAQIILHGFQANPVKIKETKSSSTVNGQSVTSKYYSYEFNFKHPMSLRVELPGQGVVFDEMLKSTLNERNYRTPKKSTMVELKYWWERNRENILKDLDEQLTKSNLQLIHDLLNSEFGYAKTDRTTKVCWAKGNKFNYDDLYNAYENAVAGYSILDDGIEKDDAQEEIQKAIDIWENVVESYDPKQKKDRLTDKIISGIHYNLAEAYIWMDDYINAQKHLNRIELLNVNKFEKMAAELQKFLNDQKNRYNAHN